MIRFAQAYARRGLAVFPCRPREKRPATEHGCNDASTDADVIQEWWQQEPAYNIGIATGITSKIFVLDVDDEDAETELRKLERALGDLPPTVEAITARGRHLYFQYPREVSVGNSAGKVAPGIDVRGNGGYVLAPPSVHPSGKPYCWSVDSHNVLAAAPAWLLMKISELSERNASATPSEWRELIADGVAEGARDCTLAKITGHLLRRYVDPIIVLELMQTWNAARCAPPLPTQDVERIVNSIAGRELRRRTGYGT
jgi:hypothetical protein